MKQLMTVFLVGVFFSFATAGNSVNNGGDTVAMEFIATARQASALLKAANLTPELTATSKQIESSVESTQVSSLNTLTLNGQEVDAINNPGEKKITVSRVGWYLIKHADIDLRVGLVLHEYLGVSGFDDKEYQISHKLLDRIISKFKLNIDNFDRFISDLSALEYLEQDLASATDLAVEKVSPIIANQFCAQLGSADVYAHRIRDDIMTHMEWFPESSDEVKQALDLLNQSGLDSSVVCASSDLQIDLGKELKFLTALDSSIKSLFKITDYFGSLYPKNNP